MRGCWTGARALGGGLLMLVVLAAGAVRAADALLEQAKAMLAGGDPKGAYALLLPLEQERAGEPVYDYLLGIAALDSGRHTEAVFALERVLAVEPGNALARAEIARAYLKLGERETAERELAAVGAREDLPADAKAAIERYLSAFRSTAAGAMSWRAFIAATLGYDSNVNAATSDDVIFLLGGLPFVLDPQDTARPDWFGRIEGGASLVHPVSARAALLAGVTASDRINQDERRFDQANLAAYGGLDVRHGPWSTSGVLQYATFRLDRDAFRNALAGTLQVRRALDSVSQVTGYVQVARLTYPTQSVRNAYRYVVGGGYSRALDEQGKAILLASAYGLAEDEIADFDALGNDADYLGYVAYGARLGGEIAVLESVRLHALAGVERRNYDGQDPSFGHTRRDTRLSLALGLEYEPVERWVVSPLLTLVRNDSNLSINDYDRVAVELTVRRNFGN